MTNVQACLGLAQLERLEGFIADKKELYDHYVAALDGVKGLRILPFRREECRSNHWFFSLYLKDSGLDRDTVIEKLQAQHIQTRPVWALIHEQADYPRNEAYALDKAEDYRKYIVNLPCSHQPEHGGLRARLPGLCWHCKNNRREGGLSLDQSRRAVYRAYRHGTGDPAQAGRDLSSRILFIAPEGQLKAVITDGDIRKFFLRGGTPGPDSGNAANYHPLSLPVSERGKARENAAKALASTRRPSSTSAASSPTSSLPGARMWTTANAPTSPSL